MAKPLPNMHKVLRFIHLLVYVCVCVLSTCMSVHHVCAWCLKKPEDDVRTHGTGVTDSCEPPDVCWELNPGPLEEKLCF